MPLELFSFLYFVIIGSLACFSLGFYAPLIATPFAIVGFADDKFYLSPKLRLAFQVSTIILIYNYSPFYLLFTSDFNSFVYFMFVVIFIFIGVALINFFNFIDGLDGFNSKMISCLGKANIIYGITEQGLIASQVMFQLNPWRDWLINKNLFNRLPDINKKLGIWTPETKFTPLLCRKDKRIKF